MKKKEKLFSISASDCEWNYYRGGGKGGQKRNKTSNCVRCTHKASRASAYSENGRSQLANKRLAFKKMIATTKFRKWLKLEVSRKTGELDDLERRIDESMKRIKIESKDINGRWVEGLTEEPL